MKQFFVFALIGTMALLAVSCPSPGGTTLYVSYLADDVRVQYTIGLNDAGGKPHGEYFDANDMIRLFAASSECDMNFPTPIIPNQNIILRIDGSTTQTVYDGYLTHVDNVGANTYGRNIQIILCHVKVKMI